ncbi:MAG TPA: NUDIX hydrolase [Anaerolineales bacterium]|nr:NUDIX hydrolase [Anaerolineales bacterium]
MNPGDINFCPRCGKPVTQAERFGRLRKVCPACDWIFFHDPKVAVATLIQRNDEVLFVRRAINPRRGLWTLPAGFVDAGEDPRTAAARECLEETGLQVRITGLLDVLAGQEHPNGAHIIIFYRAEICSGELHPGDDVDMAAFFPRTHLPPLAFDSTRRILNRAIALEQFPPTERL